MNFKQITGDQFFATLIFAKNFGGHSVQLSLRHLAAFIRDDIQMMEEIQTRFGWVRNSAILAASAPWLLLLLLSAQPGKISLVEFFCIGAVFFRWIHLFLRDQSAPFSAAATTTN